MIYTAKSGVEDNLIKNWYYLLDISHKIKRSLSLIFWPLCHIQQNSLIMAIECQNVRIYIRVKKRNQSDSR